MAEVFPRLTTVAAEIQTDGPTVTVHFTKKKGAPVHFVPADDPAESAAVREVDLQKKFHWTATELAKKLGLTNPKATALRRHLGIDNDPDCVHEFHFGGLEVIQYSDNSFTQMGQALDPQQPTWTQFGQNTDLDAGAPAELEVREVGNLPQALLVSLLTTSRGF